MTTVKRTTGFGAMALCLALIGASGAQALSLSDCRRITHVSYGGEARHRDLGEGRVLWLSWWSQEGVGETLVLVDCAEGVALSSLTRAENMTRDLPYDRTDAALDAILTLNASPVMRGFDQIAERLRDIRVPVEIAELTTEPCACAAAYPDLRGDRPAFEMETL